MTARDNFDRLADASPYIFTGSIERIGASTMSMLPVDASTVVVAVEDVIKAPAGFTSFGTREITVRLIDPLPSGRYTFFAEPLAVGGGFAVRERAHLDAATQAARSFAAASVEAGYVNRIAEYVAASTLIALGTIGEVRALSREARPKGVPWAVAPLEIERMLKGDAKTGRVMLVGPRTATRYLPMAPGLNSGLRAVFFLQPPPPETPAALLEAESGELFFIADSSAIQPPERLSTIDRIMEGAPKTLETIDRVMGGAPEELTP